MTELIRRLLLPTECERLRRVATREWLRQQQDLHPVEREDWPHFGPKLPEPALPIRRPGYWRGM